MIELDGDESQPQGQLALVATDEGSPKRFKGSGAPNSSTSITRVDDSFWDRIQSCVSSAVASSLEPFKEGLQTINARADQTEVTLREMGDKFENHVAAMEEEHGRIRHRLDQLQEQLVEVQKECSPSASPKSSHTTPPPGPHQVPLYLVVMGGWKEGERKEYIEVQINKLFEAAGVQPQVHELQLFGKRPRCARVTLKFDVDTPAAKRAKQQEVISRLRAQQWTSRECNKPIWITQDRTPAQRVTNRGIAIIGSFLQNGLKVSRDSLEIDNWQAARTYIGDHRVSGTYLALCQRSPPAQTPW